MSRVFFGLLYYVIVLADLSASPLAQDQSDAEKPNACKEFNNSSHENAGKVEKDLIITGEERPMGRSDDHEWTYILSINGHGLHSLIPAIFLELMEESCSGIYHRPVPVTSAFDIITGSSTCGILALALAFFNRENHDDAHTTGYPARTAREFYERILRSINDTNLLQEQEKSGGALDNRQSLAVLLDQHFHDTCLSDLSQRVIIPGYDVDSATPYLFDQDAPADPQHDHKLHEVALTLLRHTIGIKNSLGQRKGLDDYKENIYSSARNVYDHIRQLNPDKEKYFIVSIGTGERSAESEATHNYFTEVAKNDGKVQYMRIHPRSPLEIKGTEKLTPEIYAEIEAVASKIFWTRNENTENCRILEANIKNRLRFRGIVPKGMSGMVRLPLMSLGRKKFLDLEGPEVKDDVLSDVQSNILGRYGRDFKFNTLRLCDTALTCASLPTIINNLVKPYDIKNLIIDGSQHIGNNGVHQLIKLLIDNNIKFNILGLQRMGLKDDNLASFAELLRRRVQQKLIIYCGGNDFSDAARAAVHNPRLIIDEHDLSLSGIRKIQRRLVQEKKHQTITAWSQELPDNRECAAIYLPEKQGLDHPFIEATSSSGESYLIQLIKALRHRSASSLADAHHQEVTITGQGGIGKSTLALAYAHLAYEHQLYDLIHWINAGTTYQIIEGYYQLLTHIDPDARRLETDRLLTTLNTKLEGKNYLIVYDDVRTPQTLDDLMLSGGRGHHLITSRCHMEEKKSIALNVFGFYESVEYLMDATGFEATEENKAFSGLIARKIRYLPLALTHIGSYLRASIKDPQNYNLGSHLRKVSRECVKAKRHTFETPDNEDDYELMHAIKTSKQKIVAATWKITMEELIGKKDQHKCGELLSYCAYLGSEDIPIDLFKNGNDEEDAIVDKGLELLSDYAMIKKNEEYISVHRFVQLVSYYNQGQLDHPLMANFAGMFRRYLERHFRPDISENKFYNKAINVVHHLTTLLDSKAKIFMTEDDKNQLATFGKVLSYGCAVPLISQNSAQASSDLAVPTSSCETLREFSLSPNYLEIFQESIFHPLVFMGIGIIYTEMENWSEAVPWYTIAAEQGLPQAQRSIGLMYAQGKGVDHDDQKAFKWIARAAEQAYPLAQQTIGSMYNQGIGVDHDEHQAFKWTAKAAEQGHPVARYNCGVMYEQGEGLNRGDQQVIHWFTKAAEQGHPLAQFNLGVMYEQGKGVNKDEHQAFKWISKAANQDLKEAQMNLGIMYYEGVGVEKDFEKALEWITKAAERGYPQALFNLGVMYAQGKRGNHNNQQAIYWYEKAAEKGHAKALHLLSLMATRSESVDYNDQQKFERCTKTITIRQDNLDEKGCKVTLAI